MSRLTYSWSKRKWSNSQNAWSFSTERQSSAKKEKEKETIIIWLDSTDIAPIITTQTEKDLRSKCITDYLIYQAEKNKEPISIFAKYITLS